MHRMYLSEVTGQDNASGERVLRGVLSKAVLDILTGRTRFTYLSHTVQRLTASGSRCNTQPAWLKMPTYADSLMRSGASTRQGSTWTREWHLISNRCGRTSARRGQALATKRPPMARACPLVEHRACYIEVLTTTTSKILLSTAVHATGRHCSNPFVTQLLPVAPGSTFINETFSAD